MAQTGFNKLGVNLKFLEKGLNSVRGLAGYLQGFFGQTAGVIRLTGAATVASGATTVDVADTSIAATDIVIVTLKTKGTNACVVNSVAITAGSKFTITVDTDPGAGGCVFNYAVIRPVSHQ